MCRSIQRKWFVHLIFCISTHWRIHHNSYKIVVTIGDISSFFLLSTYLLQHSHIQPVFTRVVHIWVRDLFDVVISKGYTYVAMSLCNMCKQRVFDAPFVDNFRRTSLKYNVKWVDKDESRYLFREAHGPHHFYP